MKEDLLSMRNNIDFSNNRMKLLVIGNKERFIHLENFLSKLDNKDFDTKLIKTWKSKCTELLGFSLIFTIFIFTPDM